MSLLVLFALANLGMGALAADEARDKQKSEASASNLTKDLNASVVAKPTPEVEKLGGEQAVRTKDAGGDGIKRRGRQARRGEAARTGERVVDDGDGDGQNKVMVCHKPKTNAEKTLLIPPDAVPDHLGHGDFLGECDGDITPTAP